jgi:hypothetical protein
MSKTLRTLGFAALLAVSASAMMSSQASALSMTECSALFAKAKADAKISGAAVLKWNDFRKANCAADAAAVEPAPAPAAKPVKPAKATAAAPAPAAPAATAAATGGTFMQQCSATWQAMKAASTVPAGMTFKDFQKGKCLAPVSAAPAAPVATAAATGGTFMQQCSATWQAMKAASTVPAGMTFKDFQKGKCVAPAGTVAAAPAVEATPMKAKKPMKVAPAEPTGTTLDTTEIAKVDKNGKPRTEKQIAAIARIRMCGNLWRGDKAAGKLAPDMKWSTYWHECSDRLKAEGK